MGNIMEDSNKKHKKPKKTPRIKHKKLIILFTAILVVAAVFIIKAFSSKHYALAEETDSFEIERPTSGNPLDYTGKENAAICNWVIKHTSEFKTVTTGTVKAKVAVISYNQELKNTRIVTKDGCYIETISDSSLVHVYEEKYLENKQVVVRKNHSDKYATIGEEEFLEKYGWHPTEFQAYILNEDTILEANIEAYEDNYKLTLTLDPKTAVPKKQRETKTIGNAKGYPGYKETVLTVILAKDWTPLEVDTYEVYDIGMPGLGDITCKCDMVEIFEYGEFEIPDKALFKEHINDTPGGLDDDEKSVISYLQEVFGPLIQGNMNDFEITVEALDTKLDGNLNVNLGLLSGINVNANIDDIFVSYQGNDVYIKLGENKYKVNINQVKQYLGDTNSTSSALDLNSIISQVEASEIKQNGNDLTIVMNLELMGIKATVNINAALVNDLYKFKDIYATVDIMGEKIILTMKEASKFNYPKTDSTYENISSMFFIVDEIKALLSKPLEISLTTSINDININASALYKNGLVSGNINIKDEYEINYYFKDKTIYLTYNNLAFSFNINDYKKFMDKEIKLDTTSIKLGDILAVIKTLNIDILDSEAFDLSIDLSKYVSELKDLKVSVSKTDSLNVRVDKYNLDLSIKVTDKEVDEVPELEYVNIANFDWLVNNIIDMISYDAYNFSIDLTYKDVSATGNIYLDKDLNVEAIIDVKYQDYEFKNIKVDYIDNVTYISFNNIKIKAGLAQVIELIEELPEFDLDMILDNLYISDSDNNLNILLDLTSKSELLGKIYLLINQDMNVNVHNTDFNANVTVTSTSVKEISVNESEYIDLNDLQWLIDDIKDVVEYDAFNFAISATYKDLSVSGNIYLNKNLEVEASLDLTYAGVAFNDVKLMYKNKEVFLSYGNLTVKLNLDDIDGIIAEINRVFELNISTDSMNIDFDINTLLSSLTLTNLNEKVELSVNLDSISTILGVVKVEVSKGLLVKVSNTDITLDANVTNKEYKEIELPNAQINKDEIYLLIEYAHQLKEIIEKWRYNIGFELHVNGYDIYAKVNIVTFKPNAGLSLYGKLVIFKGSNEYYAEASIIDNEAYLNFSQTITNKNKTNPIDSTTSQSIKFRISFDELIEVANYAIDKLEIDNDTIKMAINYLGMIVDTNGAFDDLFKEAKDKVKSLDLSMLNDFIDLSQIGLFVDSDNLTIDFGVNSLGKNSSISIYREDGQIKGLNTVDFEINSDILNSHFELLADENISNANYSGCLNFNGIGNLVKAGLDNYSNGEIAISGKINMEIDIPLLNLINIDNVEIDAKLDFDYNGKFRGYIYLKMPKVLIATKNETHNYIYIQDDMIYIKRIAKATTIFSSDSTETRKMSLADFGKDAMDQIIWICNFGDTVANAIKNSEKVDPKIEEVLKSYSSSNNKYNVTLDGEKLVGSSSFSDIDLALTTTTINDELYLNTIKVNTKLVSIIAVDASLTVNNNAIDWSFFPTLSTLNSYKAYNINN